MKRIIAAAIMPLLLMSCRQENPPSPDLTGFSKPAENPILRADSSFVFTDPLSGQQVHWQRADVFNPAAIVKDGKVFLLYRCEDNPAAILGGRTSRIGLAESEDGLHFKKYPTPVLYPDRDEFRRYDYPGGCEDPRVVETPDGRFIMAYTSWNDSVARLSIAVSRDLIHWEKKGPAFAKAYGGKFLDTWSKSGSMVTRFEKGHPVLARINGKYWMYWGEKFINLAWSDNGTDWYPGLNADSSLSAVISTRPYHFDSDLTECGPPAVETDAGIELFYNGKNAESDQADSSLPRGTYSVGRIVFDASDPSRVKARTEQPFLRPTLPHEISGQYKAGTTFAEGLVRFRDRWWIYYGTADSYVGVAVSK